MAVLLFLSLFITSAFGYPLKDTHTKLVDNQGNGYEQLYGTRNFRMVLDGIIYRGGANNAYHRTHKRANKNPLPEDGLKNLCEEGFSLAVYLYTTNYKTASKTTNCGTNTLTYLQISPLEKAGQFNILKLIYNIIKDPKQGPIYTHCWNGWHASGLISALALRQFCDMNGVDAVAYWSLNTDGTGGSSSYNKHRSTIRNFIPFKELEITEEEKAKICI